MNPNVMSREYFIPMQVMHNNGPHLEKCCHCPKYGVAYPDLYKVSRTLYTLVTKVQPSDLNAATVPLQTPQRSVANSFRLRINVRTYLLQRNIKIDSNPSPRSIWHSGSVLEAIRHTSVQSDPRHC